MSVLSTALINQYLNDNDTRAIRSIFSSANIVLKEIVNEDYKNSTFFRRMSPLLLRATLLTHFKTEYIPKHFPFEVSIQQKGYQPIIVLENGPLLLTINAAHKDSLPKESSYKKSLAINNGGLTKVVQIKFNRNSTIVDDLYYGIITYKHKNNLFQHISVVLPDCRYKSIIDSVTILGEHSPQLSLIENESIYADNGDDGQILSEENLKKGIKRDIKEAAKLLD